jgi:hypothetical protein
MGSYYYTPFEKTDENERAAWNICRKWGAKFADWTCRGTHVETFEEEKVYETVNPEAGTITTRETKKRTFLKPSTLAKTLVEEGLKNVKCNISLLCCFGGGIQQGDIKAFTKASSQGVTNTALAHFLAKELGVLWQQANQWKGHGEGARVSGYVGATNSKRTEGSFDVDVTGEKQFEPAENHKKWYDLNGLDSSPNLVTPGETKAGMNGLAEIGDGDVLYIMAHGDWQHGGRYLPFPGGLLDKTVEAVNRAARMKGEAAVVDNQAFAAVTAVTSPKAVRWSESEAPQMGRFKGCWVVWKNKQNIMYARYFNPEGRSGKKWDGTMVGSEKGTMWALEAWFSEPENKEKDQKVVGTIRALLRQVGKS